MVCIPSDYIDLGRRFLSHDENAVPNEAANASYLFQWGQDNTFGWDELLKTRGVHVVLGEAGSGRTYEFKAKARALRSEGKTAFFLSLHRLVSETLEQQMDAAEHRAFSIWLKGSGAAYFFLDAVDESKLTRNCHFREVLDKLGLALAPAISRAHIFISSRVKDWLPVTDRRNVIEAFGLTQEPPNKNSWKDTDTEEPEAILQSDVNLLDVWNIAVLDANQVGHYVEGRGVRDSAAFMAALTDAHAWELASRPLDVDLLVRYWKTHHRIGQPAEMFEHLVTSQLAERPGKSEYERAFPLDPGRGRQGAETLAAATILCCRLDFQINDELSAVDSSAALDAQLCLPADWKPTEIHALLSRPLFDGAIYGCTRFHHRRLAEYLAACWLVRLLQQECPTDEVIDLLFASSRGQPTAKHSRIAVAVWLACIGNGNWVSTIREQLLESAPEAFLRFGDPSILPAAFKSSILEAVVRRYSNREILRIETSDAALSRMGDPALTEALIHHLGSREVSDALKCELAGFARVGRVRDTVPVALALLRDGGISTSLRTYLMWLVQELGSPEQFREMATWVVELPALDCDLCWEAVHMLFPLYIQPSEVCGLITRLCNPGEANLALAHTLHRKFSELESQPISVETMKCILELIEQPPFGVGLPFSQRFLWMMGLLRPLIRVCLKPPDLSDNEQILVGKALWIATQKRISHELNHSYEKLGQNASDWDSETLSGRYSLVRRTAFWLHYDQESLRRPDLKPWFTASWVWGHDLHFKAPSSADFEWLLLDLADRASPEDRRLASLDLAIRYYRDTGRSAAVKSRILISINDSISLMAAFKAATSKQWTIPVRTWWQKQGWEGFRTRYWWTRKGNKIKAAATRQRNAFWLLWNRGGLSQGHLPGALCDLIRMNGTDSKWAPENWDKVSAQHGRRAASAAQQGCIAIWEQYDPRETGESTNRSIAGLAGLQWLWKSGRANFAAWTEAQAAKATRYALSEMNGFSDWLPALAKHHPSAVKRVIDARLDAEWHIATGGGFRVIFRLRWSKSLLGRLLASSVLERLQVGDPGNCEDLNSALQLLILYSETSHETYAEIAARRIAIYPPGAPAYRLWLLIWLQTDTPAALDFFENAVSSQAISHPEAVDLAIIVCASLNNKFDRETRLSNPRYLDPAVAPRFIRWVHGWVTRETDLIHGSGGYSPTPRDDAQSFRGNLPSLIADQNTPEAEAALMMMMDSPELTGSRDYLQYLLDGLSRRLSDGQPWAAQLVRQFEMQHQAQPLSISDLFGIACRRILQIKSEVEEPFDSILNPYVREGDTENVLRGFLALRLRELSKGLYTAPQEAVIRGERRPDLRIENPAIPGSVPIEVKLADNRGLNSLISDLEGQLVGDYLSSHHSRYGLFVVGLARTRHHFNHPTTNAQLSFAQAIEYLQARALELVSGNGPTLGLKVMGIDFVPRPSARSRIQPVNV
jgi:hypothetical protein